MSLGDKNSLSVVKGVTKWLRKVLEVHPGKWQGTPLFQVPLQKTRAGNPSLSQRVTTALADGTYSTETWKHQIIFILVWIYIPKRRVGPTNWLKRVYKSRRVPTLFTRCVARQRSVMELCHVIKCPLHEGSCKINMEERVASTLRQSQLALLG